MSVCKCSTSRQKRQGREAVGNKADKKREAGDSSLNGKY